LFQIYAIETLSINKESQISGVDNQILTKISKTKLKLLSKLKHFKNRKPLPFKKIYISTKNNKKQTTIMPCIIDRLIQQLFILVLNPFIESNLDSINYGFRKGRNQIMVIGALQKNIQYELKKNNQKKPSIFI
jgi:retron-type reverse transcriptase